jgi:type I restriction enzyme, S subunit
MKKEWKMKPLGEVSVINYGYTESATSDPIGPKFLRITDIQDDGVNWDDVPFCPIEASVLKKFKLAHGDIVFARTGATTGKSFLVSNPPEAVFASYLIRLRLQDMSLLPEYVSLYFQSKDYWNSIREGSSGSAQGGFNASKLAALTIPVPPLPEQQRIVAILDEAFEAIAAARANAEQNRQNARSVFESVLNSVSGENTALGDYVTIKTGKLDSNAAIEGGEYPFFTCAKEIYAIDNFAFDCEAILLAGNNAVGDFNVKHYRGKFNAYQRTYVITINNEDQLHYRFLYFQMLKSLRRFKEQSVGAGTKFLKLGMIKSLDISLPSLEEQNRLVLTLDSVLEETQRLDCLYKRKIAVLDELKQSLLQQAFSGQLDTTRQEALTQ